MRLRYAAGIAGLVLATAGILVPVAQARTTASTSAQSAGTLPARTVAPSCIGTKQKHAAHNHEALTVWYGRNGCIGMIQNTVAAGQAHVCATPELAIYAHGRLVFLSRHSVVCGNITLSYNTGRRFATPVTVRAWAPIVTGGRGELGPVSVTINR